uniref:Uncharacterized protein n=1 Tax=Heterorhabditis bacteriophora TaxID=37862 RepID=A0A1I7WT45_HETBA
MFYSRENQAILILPNYTLPPFFFCINVYYRFPYITVLLHKFCRLQQYKGGALIADEELFLFKSPITMEKEMSSLLKSEVAVPLDPLDMDIIDENDTDGTESVASKEKHLTSSVRNSLKSLISQPVLKDARGRATVREDEVVRALWKLRDQLLESTCNVSSEKEYIGLL